MNTLNKLVAAIVCAGLAVFVGGCAAPQYGPASYVQERSEVLAQSQSVRAQRDRLKQKLALETAQAEIEELRRQIQDADSRIARLEARQRELDRLIVNTGAAPGQNIGPKGGCYTITKSGKKNYGGC